MAYWDLYPTPPIKGENPYVDIVSPSLDPSSITHVRIFPSWENRIPNIWTIENITSRLITSAVVANRQLYCDLVSNPGGTAGGGEDGVITSIITGDIAASETGYLFINSMGTLTNAVLRQGDVQCHVEWRGIIIKELDYLNLSVNNEQAGDLFKVWVRLRYMNWFLGVDKQT